MRQRFPFLDKVYWGTPGIWSIGHFVSTVEIDEEVIRQYIERQGQEDRGQAKLEFQERYYGRKAVEVHLLQPAYLLS